MFRTKLNSIIAVSSVIGVSGLMVASFGALPQKFIDSTNAIIDTLRKRDCTIKVSSGAQPLAGKAITVKQIRNHFGFGASIGYKWFMIPDSVKYGNAFRTYFDWATPENEMKWEVNEELDDYQNFQSADLLIAWCAKHHIKVRGHNLFWNEKLNWMPAWAKELDKPGFKAAMKRRIDGTMAHFKGKVAHWDIINEIVHGPTGQLDRPGLLATMSGDTNVFSWIFKEARAIDPDVKMGVNEFGIITKSSAANAYINEIKNIELDGGKIDIVGLEGHLGDYVERESYLERIDTVAKSLPHELWLTEVDFLVDTLLRADKMEELMRTCFAHPRIGGLVLWVWWEGNRWRPYTSFLVDSNFTENELGVRWRTVRDEWKTTAKGSVGADGQFTFRGFQGEYIASVQVGDSLCIDTFEVLPGKGVQTVDAPLIFSTGIASLVPQNRSEPVSFGLNGRKLHFNLPQGTMQRLNMSIYSLSGKRLSRVPVGIENGKIVTTMEQLPAGCHLITIESDRKVYYSNVTMQTR